VRTDSGLAAGMTVTSAYDPMLAKIIAWAPDRDAALRRLDGALAATAVLGVTTNTAFLRALLSHPDVLAGRLDTGLVERHLGELTAAGVPDEVLAAAALAELLASQPAGPVTDPWDVPDGWRPGEHAWTRLRLACAPRETAEVRIRAQPARTGTAGTGAAGADVFGAGVSGASVSGAAGTSVAAEVSVDGAGPVAASAAPGPDGLLVTYAGQTRRYACARDGSRAAGSGASPGGVIWLGAGGHTWMVREEEALAVRRDQAGSADGTVRSPMPGTVQAVPVIEGQPVTAGQPLVFLEAMKMEHTVTAPLDGTVTELLVKGGQQVAMDETLAVVRAAGPAAPDGGPAPEGSADRAAPDEPSAP
jgi:acetyl-CoA/propionyl-CoA carboxylase biotin carboxyl carrier protein